MTISKISDLGNAVRLATFASNRFRYVRPWGTFMVWDGHRWARDHKEVAIGTFVPNVFKAILSEAKAEARPSQRVALKTWWAESQSGAHISSMVRLVRSVSGVQAEPAEFNSYAWLLPVQNGTVNLQTGKLLLLSPEHRFTRVSPVRFDASRKCATWEAFLAHVLPDAEVRAFLQMYVGYCLTGDVGARLMLICIGTGRNGKSVFLRVLGELLGMGEFAVAANSDLLLTSKQERHAAEIAALFGARVALLSEVRKGRQWDEEKVKRYTGNDILAARGMGENWWNFQPTAKLIAAMNARPAVADYTDSFWDRIALVPFHVRISDEEEDKGLLDKLRQELSGILNWAIAGCVAYQRAGRFMLPKACKEARDTYRQDEDQLGACLGEILEQNVLGRVSNEEIAQRVNDWCLRNGKSTPWSKKSISARMQDMTGVTPWRTTEKRGWAGVRIRGKKELSYEKDGKKSIGE